MVGHSIYIDWRELTQQSILNSLSAHILLMYTDIVILRKVNTSTCKYQRVECF